MADKRRMRVGESREPKTKTHAAWSLPQDFRSVWLFRIISIPLGHHISTFSQVIDSHTMSRVTYRPDSVGELLTLPGRSTLASLADAPRPSTAASRVDNIFAPLESGSREAFGINAVTHRKHLAPVSRFLSVAFAFCRIFLSLIPYTSIVLCSSTPPHLTHPSPFIPHLSLSLS